MAYARIHASHAREGLDKAVLFAAFLAGAGGTVWLKMIEVPVLLVALFPVLVLIAYVAACLALRNIGTEPETIGDNSYYLGFLFTLASLAVTLYRIKDISAQDADLIPVVISGFGVALSSTIAGVFLRLFLLQLRPDIVARDRAARRDLATGARDLRQAAAQASLILKQVAIETQQHVAERNNKMSKVLEIQAETTSELLERQAKACDDIIREFGRKMSEEVAGVLRQHAGASAAELQAATAAFCAGLEALGSGRETAEQKLRSGLDGFRDVVEQIQTVTAEHGKVTEASHRMLAARGSKLAKSLVSATDLIDQAVAQAERAAGANRLSTEATRAGAEGGLQTIREGAKAVTQAMQELEAALSIRGHAVAALPLAVPAAAAVTAIYGQPHPIGSPGAEISELQAGWLAWPRPVGSGAAAVPDQGH
jgi:hypothetical protein